LHSYVQHTCGEPPDTLMPRLPAGRRFDPIEERRSCLPVGASLAFAVGVSAASSCLPAGRWTLYANELKVQ